jgi:hypothetical protein
MPEAGPGHDRVSSGNVARFSARSAPAVGRFPLSLPVPGARPHGRAPVLFVLAAAPCQARRDPALAYL